MGQGGQERQGIRAHARSEVANKTEHICGLIREDPASPSAHPPAATPQFSISNIWEYSTLCITFSLFILYRISNFTDRFIYIFVAKDQNMFREYWTNLYLPLRWWVRLNILFGYCFRILKKHLNSFVIWAINQKQNLRSQKKKIAILGTNMSFRDI